MTVLSFVALVCHKHFQKSQSLFVLSLLLQTLVNVSITIGILGTDHSIQGSLKTTKISL